MHYIYEIACVRFNILMYLIKETINKQSFCLGPFYFSDSSVTDKALVGEIHVWRIQFESWYFKATTTCIIIIIINVFYMIINKNFNHLYKMYTLFDEKKVSDKMLN